MANKFESGEIQYTEGVLGLRKEGVEPDEFLARHLQGDWGDINNSDKALNRNALRKGLRLMSDYETAPGEWLVIITNLERTMTSIKLYKEWLREDGFTEEEREVLFECKTRWNNKTPKELRGIKISIYLEKFSIWGK